MKLTKAPWLLATFCAPFIVPSAKAAPHKLPTSIAPAASHSSSVADLDALASPDFDPAYALESVKSNLTILPIHTFQSGNKVPPTS